MHSSFHFIAIGGAVMHQLAIFLHQQQNTITGSDDVIFDPAKSNLKKHDLLPKRLGWHKDNIHKNLDGVVLGMHAKAGNPELEEALRLGIPIYSFPAFIYERSKEKQRIVVAGSHGKTSITSMIMHILNTKNKDFDYLVGSSIKGFETMVKVSDAPIIVIEGDEYLSSALDSRSKFLHYQPDVAIISGIAWDHINVFPTFDSYLNTFEQFIASVSGSLIYYENDEHLQELVSKSNCQLQPYKAIDATYEADKTLISFEGKTFTLNVFGQHNMENLQAAIKACEHVGISAEESLQALTSFEGSAKRLELVYSDDSQNYVYRDFAHAPSKLKASLKALREKHANQKIVAVFELHTYSSLQENFLKFYADSLVPADVKAVFLDSHALKIKQRPNIEDDTLRKNFNDADLPILRNADSLSELLSSIPDSNTVVAFMSSGNFANFNIADFIESKFSKK